MVANIFEDTCCGVAYRNDHRIQAQMLLTEPSDNGGITLHLGRHPIVTIHASRRVEACMDTHTHRPNQRDVTFIKTSDYIEFI
jgi:hypothetical protein